MFSLPYDIRYQVNYVMCRIGDRSKYEYVGRGDTAAQRKEDCENEATFRNTAPRKLFGGAVYEVVEVKH